MHTSSGPTHLALCGMSVLIIWILPRIGISEESPVPLNEGGVDGVDEQSSRSSNDDEPQSDPVPDDTPCSKIDCSGMVCASS